MSSLHVEIDKLFSNVPTPYIVQLLAITSSVTDIYIDAQSLQEHVLSASINGTSFQHLTR